MLVPVSLLIIAGVTLASPWAHRLLGRWTGAALAIAPAALAVWWALAAPGIIEGDAARWSAAWVGPLDVPLAFSADGLSLLFALLVLGVGALVVLYASGYMKGDPQLGRFYAFLFAFMGSMLGVVVSDSLLLLYVFWELTSITSFLLIGYNHASDTARKAAVQALLVTATGGLCMLGGLVLLGLSADVWTFTALIENKDALTDGPLHVAAIVLVLLGAFTKSAMLPFHFWLPGAMEAPTPVSAYLHSSTMVKAGIYLLARLHPALGGHPVWDIALVVFGGLTMIVGGYLATRETYFKRVLAYSTVSSLGTIVMLIPLGEAGAVAAFAYLLAHAMFKGTMFLVAGIVDHEAGEKDISRTGKLARAMPITAAAAAVAAISMAGIPAMLGFGAKELLLKASLGATDWLGAIAAAATIGGIFTVFVAIQTGWRPFFGAQNVEPAKHPHEAPASMLAGPVVLGIGTLLGGLAPALFAAPIIAAAARSVWAGPSGEPPHVDLVLTHLLKLSPALILSGVALALGLALYLLRRAWVRATRPFDALAVVGPARMYERALDGVNWTAARQTRALQSGSLRSYIRFTVVGLLLLVAVPIARSIGSLRESVASSEAMEPVEIGLMAVVLGMTIAAARFRSRLAAVAALGALGYAVAVLFVLMGAPDVSMTQFAVDTLLVIIFVLVIYDLPRFTIYSSKYDRAVDLVLALIFGAVMSVLVLLASTTQIAPPISDYFAEQSVPKGYGRNVVNVILVDFRALDTLGEITVLALAAIGVYTLLRVRQRKGGAA